MIFNDDFNDDFEKTAKQIKRLLNGVLSPHL